MTNAVINIKFIADVHISPITVSELKEFGYDIKRSSEFLLPNASDEEIINLAIEKNAVIVTQDLDFSNLIILSGLKKPSIISIRIEKPFPQIITKILIGLLPKIEKELLEGCIIQMKSGMKIVQYLFAKLKEQEKLFIRRN